MNSIRIAVAEATKVTKRGKSLLNASVLPKIKLISVSKKLLFIKILTPCCQTSVPTPTNSSRPKNPINILKKDKNTKTNSITLPDSTTLKVW